MATQYTDAQIRKLFPTYFDAAATATQVDEDVIREILRMYSAKEGGRTYIGDKLKLNQSVVGRIINKAIDNKILKKVKPGEFKTKDTQRIYKDISERKIYKTVRPITANDRKINPDIPANTKFKVQVPSGKKGTSTKMIYTTTEAAAENAIKKAEKFTETAKLAKEKPFKEAVKSIHRIAMADPEDLNSIKNLSKMVYGADDVKNLTRTANDLVRYQEFLLGFRPISGISIPAGEKLSDIISEFPSSGQWGKFAAGAIRESKLKMRDQLLKTKGPKLIALRNNILKFIDSGAMELDEAMGVSATFENAPGYTELGQVIKKSINQSKRTEIDNPFSRLFAKVVAGEINPTIMHNGEEIGIKEFNKISKEFQKINKVDTPIIEYRPGESLDASKFIKHFDKLSPEAQKNVTELAKKGIALKSKAMPMGSLVENFVKKVQSIPGGCQVVVKRALGFQGGLFNETCETIIKADPKAAAVKLNNAITATKGPLKELKEDSKKLANLIDTGQVTTADKLPRPDDAKLADTFKETNLRWNDDIGAFVTPNEDVASQSDIKKYAADNPMEVKVGEEPVKAATNKSVLANVGKAMARVGAPLPVAAIDAYFIGQQVKEGKGTAEIASNPLNWLGLATMEPLAKASGIAEGGAFNKALRLGLNPATIRGITRFAGLPGLAISTALTAYDQYQKYKDGEGFIFNLLNQKGTE